ncbi:MAG: hypothetical protein ACE5KE_06890 [Methanosarcinales archaeon]
MKKTLIVLVIAFAIVVIGGVFWLNSYNSPQSSEGNNNQNPSQIQSTPITTTTMDLTKENVGGRVTVTITYLNPTHNEFKDIIAFEVKLNTHSVALDDYQMDKITYLRDSKGNIHKPLSWEENPGSGGHHRSGILKFSKFDSSGESFEIVIQDLAGIKERVFKWEL